MRPKEKELSVHAVPVKLKDIFLVCSNLTLILETPSWLTQTGCGFGPHVLKEQFTSEMMNYLVALMLMESLMNFHGQQSKSGASQQNGVAAFSWSSRGHVSKQQHKKMAAYSSNAVIKVSGCPEMKNWFEKTNKKAINSCRTACGHSARLSRLSWSITSSRLTQLAASDRAKYFYFFIYRNQKQTRLI